MAGKIFTKEEADKLFGNVLKSASVNIEEFNTLMKNTEKNLMFKIYDNKLYILGDGRQVLYPAGSSVDKDSVFIRYSKPLVEELLNKSNSAQVIIELRTNHTTVTYGNYTLEEGLECPPFCW